MINIDNLPRILCSAVAVALLVTTMPDAANALTGAERRAAAAAKRAEAQAEADARRSGGSDETPTPPPPPPPPPPPANNPPSISGTPATTVELGKPYSFRPTASDADGDSLTFSIGGKPSWAQFNPSTGQLSGTPTANSHVGTTGSIWISVSDGAAAANLSSFMITVTPPPVVESPPVEPPPVEPPVEPPVTPPPADGLVSSALPSTYRWDTLATGKRVYVDRNYTFVDVPADYVGWRLLQTENDDKYVSDPQLVSFDVTEPVRVVVGYDRRISALPGWLQSYAPTGEVMQSSDVAFNVYYRHFPAGRVTLGGNENGFSNYTVAVAPLDEILGSNPPPDPEPVPPVTQNTPPEISGRPLSMVQLGSLYSFTPAASDADGDELTFSISNKPSWAQFDSRSGRLRGTPTANSHVGSSSVIRIGVSDGRGSASLYFRITVTPPPATEPPATEPPVTEPPVTEPPVTEPPSNPGDPQGDDLVSAAQPSSYRWDTLAPGKRVYVDRVYEFSTIPGEYIGWRYLQTLNDDKYFAEPDRVRFDVSEPVRVVVGFDRRITNLPEWAQSFTPTGESMQSTDTRFNLYRLDFPAGTVVLGGNEMGRSNYTVAVAPLTDVDDPVAPPSPSEPPTASGAVELTWDPPLLNEDGSQLRDLAGFSVRWGRTPGQWQQSETLPNPGLTTYMVEGLASGEWFFTVTAFDYAGNQSREADIVSTVIQ